MKGMKSSRISWFMKYFMTDMKNIFREHWLSLAVMGIMPVILLVFCAVFRVNSYEGERAFYISRELADFIFAVTAIFFFLTFPINAYGRITDRRKGAQFLMLPASHGEKFMSMFLNSVIVFPVVFMAVYLSADWAVSVIFPDNVETSLFAYSFGNCPIREYDNIRSVSITFTFFLPYMVSCAGMTGAVLFRKHKISKTFLTCTVSFILVFAIYISILDSSLPDRMSSHQIIVIWYIFQTFAAVCCLSYVWLRTRKITL